MNSNFHIVLPLGEEIVTRKWLRVVPIIISDREFYVELVILDMQDFDVILVMDLLSKYNVVIHGH